MLEIRKLNVRYGAVTAVQDLDLDLAKGEVVALVGANGAGKSSTLKAIAGLADAGGTVRLDGTEVGRMAAWRRPAAGIALSPEGRQVFGDMQVRENLELGAVGAGEGRAAQGIEEMYALFPRLRERQDQAAGTLSGGEQQMLAIARALMCRPRVIMLDEPTLGLAPIVVRQIAQIIQTLRAGGLSVLLSEQNVEMALAVSDRAYVIESGRLVRSGPSAALAGDPMIQAAYLGL